MSEKKAGYGLVRKSVMTNPEIHIEAKGIYAYLCSFANAKGECFPSVQTMCAELHIGKDRFYRHIDQLIDEGIVTKTKQRNGNRYERNLYTLTQHPFFKETRNEETGSFQDTQIQIPGNEDARNPYTQNQDSNNSSLNNPSLNIPKENTPTVYDRVCLCLNRAKKAYGSKGRVKPSAGSYMLHELFRAGFSAEKIEAEAVEYAEYCIANNLDADWSLFVRFCLDRKKNSRP